MDTIDFYKFIEDNNIEYHWHELKDGSLDVIFFVEFYNIKYFHELLSPFDFEEGGIDCVMKDGYLCFWANSILEPHDIELTKVFKEITEIF